MIPRWLWWTGGAFAVGTLIPFWGAVYKNGQSVGFALLTRVDGVLATWRQADVWRRLKAAAAADGVTLKLNSAFRTMGEQVALYAKYLVGGTLAAKPGYSNHQNGLAFDIDVGGNDPNSPQYRWLAANGARFGLRNTGLTFSQIERWHWELAA